VESTVPENGDTSVDRESGIRIVFSEEMNRVSVERAFSISPIVRLHNFVWDGRSLVARPVEDLPDSTTFVVKVSATAQDYHGVAMEAPASLSFSTGETVDTGSISGLVVRSGEPLAGATVRACLGVPAPAQTDGPDPCRYSARTEANGTFTLSAVAASERPYTLFAFVDADGDGLWSPETETGRAAEEDAAVDENGVAVTGVVIDLTAEEE
jgi:hypothetical protein